MRKRNIHELSALAQQKREKGHFAQAFQLLSQIAILHVKGQGAKQLVSDAKQSFQTFSLKQMLSLTWQKRLHQENAFFEMSVDQLTNFIEKTSEALGEVLANIPADEVQELQQVIPEAIKIAKTFLFEKIKKDKIDINGYSVAGMLNLIDQYQQHQQLAQDLGYAYYPKFSDRISVRVNTTQAIISNLEDFLTEMGCPDVVTYYCDELANKLNLLYFPHLPKLINLLLIVYFDHKSAFEDRNKAIDLLLNKLNQAVLEMATYAERIQQTSNAIFKELNELLQRYFRIVNELIVPAAGEVANALIEKLKIDDIFSQLIAIGDEKVDDADKPLDQRLRDHVWAHRDDKPSTRDIFDRLLGVIFVCAGADSSMEPKKRVSRSAVRDSKEDDIFAQRDMSRSARHKYDSEFGLVPVRAATGSPIHQAQLADSSGSSNDDFEIVGQKDDEDGDYVLVS